MTHRRVKDIEFDDDYKDDEYDEDDVEVQLRAGTIKVREALGPASKTLSDETIHETLYHYYYDVPKSVAWLQKTRLSNGDTGKGKQVQKNSEKKQQNEGAYLFTTSFSLLQHICFIHCPCSDGSEDCSLLQSPDDSFFNAKSFFQDCPWLRIPLHRQSDITVTPLYPRGGLLGGSAAQPGKMSKLAALAAKRRQKENERQNLDPDPDASASAPPSALAGLRRAREDKPSPASRPSLGSSPPNIPPNFTREPTPRPKPEKHVPDQSSPEPESHEPAETQSDQPFEGLSLQARPSAFAQTLLVNNYATSFISVDQPVLSSDSVPVYNFAKPSPDDIVLQAQSQSTKLTSRVAVPKSKVAKKADSGPDDELEDGVQKISISAPAKVKSRNLDVVAEHKKATGKNEASFVVTGHVDSGKSTLMGRLLFECNAIDAESMREYEREAEKAGKGSFAFAWLMDQGREERERGVTIYVTTSHFETDKSSLTILDAPGHKDFVSNMIGGTSEADFAVLVIDASPNEFERGLKGQTREHALLARSMGIDRVIVAINKMDRIEWSEERFTEIQHQVQGFLTSTGFKVDNLAFVPCSGLRGDNISKAYGGKEGSWYEGSTLIQELDKSKSKTQEIAKPFRMTLNNVYDEDDQPGLFLSGRINAGNVQLGEELVVVPGGEKVNVRSIQIKEEGREWAVAGNIVTLGITQTNDDKLRIGYTLCSASSPAQAVTSFTAIVLAFDHLLPLPLMVYQGHVERAGKIKKLVSILDSAGKEIIKKKPKIVHPGKTAKIEVELEEAAVIEKGRVVLRSDGETTAAGHIVGDST